MTVLPERPVLEGHVELTTEQLAAVERHVTELYQAVALIPQTLRGNLGLERNLASNALTVAESHLHAVFKLVGIESESAAERASRYAALREANRRIRELEGELGRTVTAAATQQSIKGLADIVKRWWGRHGFGHVAQIDFGAYGLCKLRLSCHLAGHREYVDCDDNPARKPTFEEWFAQLEARGFQFHREGSSRSDIELLDCDTNRDLVRALVLDAFPSAAIGSMVNRGTRNGRMVLQDVEVYVYELLEIEALGARGTSGS